MVSRRIFMAASSGVLVGLGLGGVKAARAAGSFADLTAELERLEKASGGRLGVALHDAAGKPMAGQRVDERFPMCSTFKMLAAAAILGRVDAGEEKLDRRVVFGREEIVPYSPVTENHVGGAGMSLAEICVAAVTLSDNTAGNLLLAAIGGPAGLTAYARSLGDEKTRLDRIEPDLNEARPGDPRDTTTPAAMAGNIHTLVFGDALSPASRDRLTGWLLANRTGGTRIRAGVPGSWRVGDKTGGGANGTNNDVGVLWPPEGRPVILAVYMTGATVSPEERHETIASSARAVAAALGG